MARNALLSTNMVRKLFKRISNLNEFDRYLQALVGWYYRQTYDRRGVTRLGGWNLDTQGGTIESSSDVLPYPVFEQTWEDMRVSPTTARGGASPPSFSKFLDDGAGSAGVWTWEFSHDQNESIQFEIQLPHAWVQGTGIEPHVHWAPETGAAGDVVFEFEYTLAAPNGTFINTVIDTITVPADGTAYKHQIDAFADIDMTDLPISTIVLCRMARKGSDAADTYGDSVYLLSFDFHHLRNSNGSDLRYTKTTGTVIPTPGTNPPTPPDTGGDGKPVEENPEFNIQ